MKLTVKNFEYNGFCGRLLGGDAVYTATFLDWTNDPGVAKFLCSDGFVRLIPTFAIEDASGLPKQDLTNKVLVGAPSHS